MRSKWKGPFIDICLYRKKKQIISLKDISNPKLSLTRSRRSTILPFMSQNPLKIYNGNRYNFLNIKLYHIGHKLGDFVLTKKKCVFRKKKKK